MKRRARAASLNEDEVKLRREKGRRAQQEFRQRQIDTINELRASNQAMQAAIVSIARVASRLGDAELDAALLDASLAAGTDGLNSAGTSGAQPRASPSPVVLSEPAAGPRHASRPAPTSVCTRRSQDQGPSIVAAHRDQQGYQTGRMSPRLGFGLWLERPVLRLRDPPSDIAPYLHSDRTSLSTVVFWSGMLWAGRFLQDALNGSLEAAVTARRIFGVIAVSESDQLLLHSIHARLSFRRKGYLDADHPGYDPDIGTRLHSLAARLYSGDDVPFEALLRPEDVEDLFRKQLGADYRVIERGLQGLGSSADMTRVRALVDLVIKSSACMGDGPRWRTDQVQPILESWVAWHGSPES